MRITTFPPLKWGNIVWNDERALHASLSILVCMLRHLIILGINVRTQNQLIFAFKKQFLDFFFLITFQKSYFKNL